MSTSLERRLLQIAVAMAGVVPIAAGLAGVLRGALGEGAAFDNHFRYLSGLLLGLGLLAWSLIPAIERRTAVFRALTFVVFTGGLGRLYAFYVMGDPGPMRWALLMELGVTPALCLWQARVASPSPAPARGALSGVPAA
jgi:hypothetical protein